MSRWIAFLFLTIFFACKNKTRESTESYFSAVSFIKAQVKQMDTVPFNFVKIETSDSTSDTINIARKDFSKYVNDFLTLPDIASNEKYDQYEESNTYDEEMNTVLLTYTPKNNEEEIRRQTVMLEPSETGESKVRTILINSIRDEKNATIEKEMTWHVNQHFQIVTKITKDNLPEKISTIVIKWN